MYQKPLAQIIQILKMEDLVFMSCSIKQKAFLHSPSKGKAGFLDLQRKLEPPTIIRATRNRQRYWQLITGSS